ncbi:hypothetical protein [Hyphomicrobium sp.]|uniref:hypothetical protein n=1 Tax=Hyphomicrobium sp. TaxID=82 RepID=UPI0025BAE33D|nr:hypothetical protein [Hyphomicrobium sp.]MCC7253188.1 hypothetical protein [Hyphomicrobium sp.]
MTMDNRLRRELFGEPGRPPDIEHVVGILQAQLDEIAASIVDLSRKPITRAEQDKLMSLMLGYQAAGFSLVAAGYTLATAPPAEEAP